MKILMQSFLYYATPTFLNYPYLCHDAAECFR